MNLDTIWIASFDIGSKNFAFYIEEVSISIFKDLNFISKDNRYSVDGTPTLDFQEVLEQVYTSGHKILLKNYDITKGMDKTKYFDLKLCYNLTDVLNLYTEYWDKVSFFVVEQQMSFGKKHNTKALKLGQHCESYFINRYGRCNKKVIEFPAYHKTQVLGAEKNKSTSKTGKISYKNMKDKERKKWAISHATYILSLRDDFETMSEIGSMKKCDDVSDTIIQVQAFKYLNFCRN